MPPAATVCPFCVNRTSQAAYGPKDILDLPPSTGGMQPAAHFVARFGTIGPADPGKQDLIRAFLSQWPEGPQLR